MLIKSKETMATTKAPGNQRKGNVDTLKCLVTNLSKRATPKELARQEILKQMLDYGYSKADMLLDSNFLGHNGQTFSADIIVLSKNAVLHTDPLLVVNFHKKPKIFNYDWVTYWQDSGAKVLAWYNGENLKIFSLNDENEYHQIPPFIPKINDIYNLKNLGIYRLKSSFYPGFDLKKTLTELHDHLYGNSNIRIPSRLAIEIQKLLLIKKFDEEEPGEICNFYIARQELPKGLNGNRTIPTEAFDSVGKRIRELERKYYLAKNRKRKMSSLQLNNASIYYAVFQLEGISLTQTPTDVLGDALETFRAYAMKKEGGQFFTHRYVVELALKLVGFTGKQNQTLADISCGTSGFLHCARKLIIQSAKEHGLKAEKDQNELISQLLLGVEVDRDLVQISNTSPEFENLSREIVVQHDSLAPFKHWKKSLLDFIAPNSRAFMVGNPPFGTKITVKDQDILESFILAKAWKKDQDKWKPTKRTVPRSPDILFIERNLELLIPGSGSMVLVVPYQILSGPREEFVREWLMTNCKILAVVDLPEDTFQPYTGTKGSLLVAKRRKNPNPLWEDEDEYHIFMARPRKIGHDRRGRPVFKDEQFGIIDTDFPEIAKAFDVYIKGDAPNTITESAFKISSKLIKRSHGIRLNAAYYEPSSSDLRQHLLTVSQKNTSLVITPLEELVNDIFYPGRFKRNYTDDLENSVPFLGGSNINQLIPVTQKRVFKDSLHYDKLALKAGWILITRSGTTGLVATVPEDWEGYAASEHIIRIVPNPKKLHPGYLYGYLRSQIGQRLLQDGIFGSVIDEINCSYIASIPVLHPKDLREANKIGERIYQADDLRTKASKLINETTLEIEKFIL